MAADGFDRLTEREREVLRLVYHGLRSKEIALKLDLSPLTIDDHVKSARRTLGVSSRHAAAAALMAWERPSPKWGTLTEHLPDQDYTSAEPVSAAALGERRVDYQFAESGPLNALPSRHDLGSYLREIDPATRLLAVAVAAMTVVIMTTGMVMILRECGPLLVHLARPLYQLV